VAAARNLGASVASGEWLAFLDDDDLWSPDKLHRLVAAADHARAAFAYSSAFVVSEALAPIAVQPAPQPESLADALLERDVMPGGCSNVVVRRAFFVETGGFDEEMSFSADWDLWVRFAHHGSGAADSAPLCAYTHHAGSWVLSGDSAIERDFERMCVKHRAWAETAGVEIDRLGFETYIGVALHRAGFRTRAARRFMRACIRYRDASSLMRAAGALVGVRRNPRSSGAIQPPEWLQGLDDLHVDDCAHEIRS
jgi:glycosyltransferase involved in cell wall biosynthesis